MPASPKLRMRRIIKPFVKLKERLISSYGFILLRCLKMLKTDNLDEANGKGTASKGLSLGRSTTHITKFKVGY